MEIMSARNEIISKGNTSIPASRQIRRCVITDHWGPLRIDRIILSAKLSKDLTSIGPGLAQITLSLFYTAVIETIYVILLFRIKRGIDSRSVS